MSWRGFSKRVMELLYPGAQGNESAYLKDLAGNRIPSRLKRAVLGPSLAEAQKFVMLVALTACVGFGYLYGFRKWR